MKMLRARLARVEEEKREPSKRPVQPNAQVGFGFGKFRSYSSIPTARQDSRTGYSDTSFHQGPRRDIQGFPTPIYATGRKRVASEAGVSARIFPGGRDAPRSSCDVAKSRQFVDFCPWVPRKMKGREQSNRLF